MAYRYTGNGEAPPGVPARDIEDEEIVRRRLDLAAIEASPLFTKTPARRAPVVDDEQGRDL